MAVAIQSILLVVGELLFDSKSQKTQRGIFTPLIIVCLFLLLISMVVLVFSVVYFVRYG